MPIPGRLSTRAVADAHSVIAASMLAQMSSTAFQSRHHALFKVQSCDAGCSQECLRLMQRAVRAVEVGQCRTRKSACLRSVAFLQSHSQQDASNTLYGGAVTSSGGSRGYDVLGFVYRPSIVV